MRRNSSLDRKVERRQSPRCHRSCGSPLTRILRGVLPIAIAAALPAPVWAACDNNAPASNQTVTCDATAPNPQTVAVVGAAGADGVGVNVLAGSELAVSGNESNIGASGNAWRVSNSGRIIGTGFNQGAAVRLAGTDSRLDNAGTIDNRTQAVSLGDRAQLNNSGTITGQSDGAVLGADSRIVNSGRISATLRNGLILGGAGEIRNDIGGRIEGGNHGAGVFSSDALQLDNRGTIVGHDGAVVTAAGASTILNRSGAVLESTGASHAALELSAGNDTVINEGTIKGPTSMYLGAGDDTLVLRSGSVLQGAAQADAGNDTLRFEGGGTLPSGYFVNFENIVLAADADWTLSGQIESGASPLAFDIAERAQLNYSGRLTGAGLNKLGAGVLSLSGDNTDFAGNTVVSAGVLRVDGILGGPVSVAAGARLQGIGRVGSLDNAGVLAPGNSIGTLSVAGDYRHRAGAILQADIAANLASDMLRVSGNARLDGGEVQVLKAPGQYAGGARYTLIDAGAGVTGRFAQLTQNLPFLELLLAYDANHVYLDVARNRTRYVDVCANFNQCQTAAVIDAISGRQSLGADTEIVLNELSTLSIDGARSALAGLGGEVHATFANVLAENSAEQSLSLSRRLLQRRSADEERQRGGAAWVNAYGGSGQIDGRDGVHGADYDARGIAIGVDGWIGQHWLLGASVHAGNLDADFAPGDRGEADIRGLSLYAGYAGDRFYLDASAGYALWDNEIRRAIRIGSIQRRAESKYDGRSYSTSIEAGFTIDMGNASLQPLASVAFERIKQDGFREAGAGDMDLVGQGYELERTTAGLGARWSYRYEGDSWRLEPTVQARWLRAFGDRHAELDAALVAATDLGFTSRGLAVPDSRAALGLGLRARRGQNLEFQFGYELQRADGFKAQGGSIGMRWAW